MKVIPVGQHPKVYGRLRRGVAAAVTVVFVPRLAQRNTLMPIAEVTDAHPEALPGHRSIRTGPGPQ
jgi:hypothetical protein